MFGVFVCVVYGYRVRCVVHSVVCVVHALCVYGV